MANITKPDSKPWEMFEEFHPTPRQLEVLELLREGLKVGEIADLLFLSYHTVKRHTYEICRGLDARNSLHAVIIAIRKGYIDLGKDNAKVG